MKKIVTFMVMLFVLFSMAGCQNLNLPSDESPIQPGDINYPLTIKDQAGTTVTIKQQPKRIVSLVPSDTEILYALGDGKQVVGVTANDDYPKQVKSLPKVGDMTINAEQVLALKPDLVLASSLNGKETIDKLRQLGLTVFVLDANSIKQVYKSIDLVGQITNQLQNSDQLIGNMEKEKLRIFQEVAQVSQNKHVKVWLESDPTLYTAGSGTLLNELVTIAGGDNVAKSLKGWPQVSAEQVVKWNPDVIISMYGDTSAIRKRAGWSTIKAVKENHIYIIDPDLVSRPGPRISQAISQLAKLFYPGQIK